MKVLRNKKKLIGVPVGLLVLLVSTIVIASLIGYIVNVQISAEKEAPLQIRYSDDDITWSEWEDAEELDLLWDIGTVYEYSGEHFYEIRTTPGYTGEVTVTFEITEESPSIIYVMDSDTSEEIQDGDSPGVSSTQPLNFKILVNINAWLDSGYDYSDMGVRIVPYAP